MLVVGKRMTFDFKLQCDHNTLSLPNPLLALHAGTRVKTVENRANWLCENNLIFCFRGYLQEMAILLNEFILKFDFKITFCN